LGRYRARKNQVPKTKLPRYRARKNQELIQGRLRYRAGKNQELFYEGYSTGPDQYGKTRNFFTVGSGDAGQGPVENILLVFKEGLEVGCGTGP
jgi:hypothetical protein